MNITVVGIGYVGLSNAVLLARHHSVICLDVDAEKVDMINDRVSPLEDAEIKKYLKKQKNKIKATTALDEAYKGADYVIVATPTDYDTDKNYFNTLLVDSVIKQAYDYNPDAQIIIKSTIPVGYVDAMRKKFPSSKIMFSPEFLREGKALYDNLYPSRIIVGDKGEDGKKIANLFLRSSKKKNVDVLLTGTTEAEAIKLFANTYLAMRVAYFNELDTYAHYNKLNSEDIVRGISLDPRIGNMYNNPSFGYGGYCLPKDTKQIKANFKKIPQNLISAIVDSNDTRKKYIIQDILTKQPKCVGIYRLVMKSGSDNFRASAIQDIIKGLVKNNIEIIIYEPQHTSTSFEGLEIVNELNKFKAKSDIIVCNRFDLTLEDVKEKVYTRDIFQKD